MTKTPQEIAEKGEALYKNRFQAQYEREQPGRFLAIDITTEEAIVADTPEQAVESAQARNPNGFFHLVKIGSAGVYRVGYTGHYNLERIIR